MAPTESTILNNFLLVPSQLPAIVSLEEFTNFFPRSQRSSPLIRALYRDLQSQRNELVDSVASNIEAEVKRAKGLRRAVARARREAESQEYDDEMEIERTVPDTSRSSHSSDVPISSHANPFSSSFAILLVPVGAGMISTRSCQSWKALSMKSRVRSSAWRMTKQSYVTQLVRPLAASATFAMAALPTASSPSKFSRACPICRRPASRRCD